MSSDMKHWYLQICGDLAFHHFDNKTEWYSKWNDLKAMFQNFQVHCPISPNCMKNAKKFVQLLLNGTSQIIAKVKEIWVHYFSSEAKWQKESFTKTMEIDELLILMDSLVAH
jgi:hypothetical protein